mgnify:CR=1 FL=1
MNRNTGNNRGSIGYQYSSQRINNVAKVQRNGNNIPASMTEQHTEMSEMDGEGIMDIARSIFAKGKAAGKYLYGQKDNIVKGAQMAQDAYTGEVGTAIRNALPDSDETARPGFAGERHAILKLANGKNGVANYMGPDTSIIKRLKRGDPGRTAVDEVSKAHDIRYALAKNMNDIRVADNKMISAVKGIERNRGDNPRNIGLAKLITAKKFAEDIGALKKDAFSGDVGNNKVSAVDKITLMSNLGGLAQKGYGLNLPGDGVVLPGDALRAKLIKQMMKKKKNSKGISKGSSIMTGPGGSGMPTHKSMGKTFAGMKNYKMIGSGMSGKGDVMNLITKNVIPLLMKAVGIPAGTIPIAGITKIISSALDSAKSGNLSSIVANLTKTILPMLTAAKMKSIGLPITGKGMGGKGILDILGKAKDSLTQGLGKILFSAFRSFIKQTGMIKANMPKGKGLKLSGAGMCGKGFWADFAKGFTSVFKPFATIAGPILDAVGLPELGIPLSAVGGIL